MPEDTTTPEPQDPTQSSSDGSPSSETAGEATTTGSVDTTPSESSTPDSASTEASDSSESASSADSDTTNTSDPAPSEPVTGENPDGSRGSQLVAPDPSTNAPTAVVTAFVDTPHAAPHAPYDPSGGAHAGGAVTPTQGEVPGSTVEEDDAE